MAKNVPYYTPGGVVKAIAVSDPTTPVSGDPVRVGAKCGLALTDAVNGMTVVNFGPGIVRVSVKGVDGAGNSAVSRGDAIYYVDADTPKLSKKTTGVLFGWALEPVGAGATAAIEVLLRT